MTVTIEEAQSSLGELVEKSARGERVVIVRGTTAVAELVPVSAPKPVPVFGSCKGMLTIVAEDDEHLADFAEYMR